MQPQALPTLNWTFEKRIGGGGQGETFLVRSVTASIHLAVLKQLRADKSSDAKARRRMFQEVANLKVLHSAGATVPAVYEHNTQEFENSQVPVLYFVMEYIEGRTLADVISESRMPLASGIEVVRQLLKTLHFAQKERIVHRDIKPENIIVRVFADSLEPLSIVMVDFGIAYRDADSANITETGEAFDNKFLSLPERRGPGEDKRDIRSDITGVCAILHYCLTGCIPRDLRDSRNQPAHRRESFTLDSVGATDVQRALLNAFFERAFNLEIDARFQRLDEVMSRLEEIARSDVVVANVDIAEVAIRASHVLKRSDRRIQLNDYENNARKYSDRLREHAGLINTKLQPSRFRISIENERGIGKVALPGDPVFKFELKLSVLSHRASRRIAYVIRSENDECIVYRVLASNPGFPSPPNWVAIDTPKLIVRYHGDSEWPKDVLETDMDQAVLEGINGIIAEIQSESQNRSTDFGGAQPVVS
jgi:serine/threonine protein kinase